MKNVWKKISITLLFCFIIGCSNYSQTNFDKIQTDMTMQEVVDILGEPTSSESLNIAGISGTTAVWKDSSARINIQFLNNKVTIKTFSKVKKHKDDD